MRMYLTCRSLECIRNKFKRQRRFFLPLIFYNYYTVPQIYVPTNWKYSLKNKARFFLEILNNYYSKTGGGEIHFVNNIFGKSMRLVSL